MFGSIVGLCVTLVSTVDANAALKVALKLSKGELWDARWDALSGVAHLEQKAHQAVTYISAIMECAD